MIWTKQFYHYDVPEWLEGDPAQPPPPPERQARPQLAIGGTSTTPTSSRCRTSGSIPGTPPGTSPSTASRLRIIDPEFAKAAARAAHPRMVHAPQRPVARLRMGIRRRQSAGPRLGRLARLPDRPQARDAASGDLRLPGARLPQAAAQLHLVGQPQGRARAATSSRAASSASTTSASSTAPRRCRPAATSTRPTAPPGWRCTA